MINKLSRQERRKVERQKATKAICSLLAMITGSLSIGIGLSAMLPPHAISSIGLAIAALIFALALYGVGTTLKDRHSVVNIVIYSLTVGGIIAFLRIAFSLSHSNRPITLLTGMVAAFSLCLGIGGAALTQHRSKTSKRSHRVQAKSNEG